MTATKITRCIRCGVLEFCDSEGICFDCCDTQVIVYSTGFIQAATPPAPVDGDKNEAA